MKEAKRYYFSVEGQTEEWYMQWLRDRINEVSNAKYRMRLICKVEKDPVKFAKDVSAVSKIEVVHLFDYEGAEPGDYEAFLDTLARMKKVNGLGMGVDYINGYSNFTFELWVLLHKINCSACTHRRQYINLINTAFGRSFQNTREFKREDHFKSVLDTLSLDDVKQAIERAKTIHGRHVSSGHVLQKHCGFSFYAENPSLNVGEIIEKILTECGVL